MTHKELHAPFYHQRGSNIGVLCIHGLFGSPNQFCDIAEVIGNLGYDCKALLLPGHGGTCQDFAKSTYKQWKTYAQKEIRQMQQKYDKLYLVGHSMGSLFCLDFADEMQVDGIILINTPMRVSITARKFVMCAEVVLTSKTIADRFDEGEGKSVYSVDNGRWFEYIPWIIPMLGIYRLIFETKLNLPNITTPTLIFQSKRDDTVSYKSIYQFKKHMKSDNTKIVLLAESNHAYFTKRDLNVMKRLVHKFVGQ